ncbi:MAG: GAF domain-containing protein [Proteobacteria bacterium]|nr:GAF domain-containing protein [Pseudomonadota bacterium]
MNYPVPDNEADRLAALQSYNVYGTEPEDSFDDLTDLAAQLTGAPISLVSIVGDANVWMKSHHGTPDGLSELPRGTVCCAHAICRSHLLVVPDTHADDRFKSLPFISTEPYVRFYAGMPLINSSGYALGTLCIMDLAPRDLSFEVTEGIRRIARQTVAQLELRRKLSETLHAQEALAAEKARADALVLNILPKEIAAELAEKGTVEPRFHPSATILFTDFVGFTRAADTLSPRELIDDLHGYFSAFDTIVAEHGLEKMKTIGDAYMAAGGLSGRSKDHPVKACLAGLALRETISRANARREVAGLARWDIRIGIHTGNVISGVVGKAKFTYDVWGDAVNVAARMESAGEPGHVNVSDRTWQHVKSYFEGRPRGSVEVKHKGLIEMHFLDRLKPEFSADAEGVRPNDRFAAAMSGNVATWSLT